MRGAEDDFQISNIPPPFERDQLLTISEEDGSTKNISFEKYVGSSPLIEMPHFDSLEEENKWLRSIIQKQARLLYMMKLENAKKSQQIERLQNKPERRHQAYNELPEIGGGTIGNKRKSRQDFWTHSKTDQHENTPSEQKLQEIDSNLWIVKESNRNTFPKKKSIKRNSLIAHREFKVKDSPLQLPRNSAWKNYTSQTEESQSLQATSISRSGAQIRQFTREQAQKRKKLFLQQRILDKRRKQINEETSQEKEPSFRDHKLQSLPAHTRDAYGSVRVGSKIKKKARAMPPLQRFKQGEEMKSLSSGTTHQRPDSPRLPKLS